MTRYAFSLLLLIALTSFGVNAQDTTQTQRDKQLQQILEMNKTQYTSFNQGLKEHDKRLGDALKNKSMDKKAKEAAKQKLASERKAYLEKHLNQRQIEKLYAFNRTNMPPSVYAKQQKESKERLKKRGITVVEKSNK